MHRDALSSAQRWALAPHDGTRGRKKTQNTSVFLFALRGVHPPRYRLSPCAGRCPPRRQLRVGTEPSASMSQQDPLNTSPAGSTPPDGTGSCWRAPSVGALRSRLIKGTHPELSIDVLCRLAPSSEKKLTLQSMTTPPRCCGLSQELRIRLARRVGLSSRRRSAASARVFHPSGQETPRGPGSLWGIFFPGTRVG